MRKLVFLMLMLSLSAGIFPDAALAVRAKDFLVLYSNSVHGETEPCG